MFKFIPVWSSTMEHQDQCMELYRNKTDVMKMKIPQVKFLYSFKPLPYLSTGVLTLEEDQLRFRGLKAEDDYLFNYYNLDTSLAYTIPYRSIVKLSRYLSNGIDWIRISALINKKREEYLIVYGAFGFSGASASERTKEIYKLIKRYLPPI